MIYDNDYKYSFINKEIFERKCLDKENDKYKKYVLISLKENNEIKYIEVPDNSYTSKYDNVISTYDVEEIISSCLGFDSMYDEIIYYHINDKYFIKFKSEDETLEYNDDSKEIKLLFN